MPVCRYELTLLLLMPCFVFSFNHPEIQWKTVATEHFLIHYYDQTECAVFAVARIAEEVYEPLARLYSYAPVKGKVNISLADYDDYTNGFADWTADNIQIWIPDDRFDLRGNTTWLRNVITHELAHIVSLSRSGPAIFDWVAAAAYRGPSSSIDIVSPVALMRFYPAWFVEGTAQYEAWRAGNDCWDSKRDMVLRCATLDRCLLSLEEMGWFNHDGLRSEMVYNQGFSFVAYLNERFSAETMANLWKQGREGGFGGGKKFDGLFADVTGYELAAVYYAWCDSLRLRYTAMVPSNPTAVMPIWSRGHLNTQPRTIRSTAHGELCGWLTNDRDDYSRTDLIVVRPDDAEAVVRIPWVKTSWCFSADGAAVYYIKSRNSNEVGSFLNDVFERDLRSGVERRITVNARIYDVAALPDGKRLLVVRYKNGAFSLAICHVGTGVCTDIIPGVVGEPFQGLSINLADPSYAVTSRIVNGQADIYIVNIDSARLISLCHTPTNEESPHWASDGRIYFGADYDGIYNIYSLLPNGSDLRRHSQVRGGAFEPAVDDKGRIFFSHYTARGFQIALLKERRDEPYYSPIDNAVCSFLPLPQPRGKVRIKFQPYRPKGLRPLVELHSFAWMVDPVGVVDSLLWGGGLEQAWNQIRYGAMAGFNIYRSDALYKNQHFFSVSLAYDESILDGASQQASTTSAQTTILPLQRLRPTIQRLPVSLYESLRIRRTTVPISHAQVGENDPTTASVAQLMPLFLMSQFAIQNSTMKPTLTFQIDALAYFMPVPIVVHGLFDAQWRIARDWYFGMTPYGYGVVQQGYGGFFMPLWLSGRSSSYINEDVAYNLGGLSRLDVYLQAGAEPMDRVSYKGDTIGEYAPCLRAGFTAAHGFSFAKYLSLVEAVEIQTDIFGGQYLDPYGRLENPSPWILEAKNTLAFNFPIIRTINRGHYYYVKDIYGRIFSSAAVIGNNVAWRKARRLALSIPRGYQQKADFVMSQVAGFSAVVGLGHAYAFGRSLEMTLAYDWWNYGVHASLRLGF